MYQAFWICKPMFCTVFCIIIVYSKCRCIKVKFCTCFRPYKARSPSSSIIFDKKCLVIRNNRTIFTSENRRSYILISSIFCKTAIFPGRFLFPLCFHNKATFRTGMIFAAILTAKPCLFFSFEIHFCSLCHNTHRTFPQNVSNIIHVMC